MKNIRTFSKLYIGLLACSLASFTDARMRYFVDDVSDNDFFSDMFEDHFEHIREQMKEMRKAFAQANHQYAPSKEDKEALKEAKANLSKIKAKIDSDDNNVYVRFNLDGVNKKDIKIVKKAHGFIGTIPTKDGKVEFFVSPYSVELARTIELKKENTQKDDKKEQTKDQEQKAVYYYSSSATEVVGLPHPIDLSTAQASTKDNTLTITIAKKKEATLSITHN